MTYRTHKIYNIIPAFLVFGFWFLVFAPRGAVASSHLDPFCFTEAECIGAPYFGQLSDFEPAECKAQGKLYQEAGFTHFCYSKPKAPLFPYKLQVPFLSVAFKGTVPGIEDYIATLYKLLISLSGVVAGIMIVWAGVKWLTAAGSPDRISDARHKISNALIGLILVLSSYVILQTINPDLVRLRLPAVKLVRQLQIASETCINRPEYPCGGIPLKQEGEKWVPAGKDPSDKYPCTIGSDAEAKKYFAFTNKDNPAQSYNANLPCSSGPKGTECIGQYCPFPGCYSVIKERVLGYVLRDPLSESKAKVALAELPEINQLIGKRGCYNKGACSGCMLNLRHQDGRYNLENIALCASSACECLVTVDGLMPVCTMRKSKGQPCNTNEECVSNECNLDPNICGPSPNNTGCDEDKDCDSGLCNENVPSDICVGRFSLANGQDCSSSLECKSGICGYSGLISMITPGWDPVCLDKGVSCEAVPGVGCNTGAGD